MWQTIVVNTENDNSKQTQVKKQGCFHDDMQTKTDIGPKGHLSGEIFFFYFLNWYFFLET